MSDIVRYQTSGTSALKPAMEPRVLTVYEGGARRERRGAEATRPARRGPGAALLAMAVALAVIGTLWVASAAEGLSARSLDARLDSAPRETVYVQPGDTLWSIASKTAGAKTSTERVVSWIMQANGLSTAAIAPGDQLVIPVLAP